MHHHPTPPDGRDTALDALRALAIGGVVLGHWLVTALVVDSGAVRVVSPLSGMPELAPVSWLLQTLALFFLVAGRVATRSHARALARGVTHRQWTLSRLARFCRPLGAVLALWTVVAGAMLVGGAGQTTVRALVSLVLTPLWFLLVLAGLTAVTPLLARLHPLWPFAVVVYADLVRFGFDGPAEAGWTTVAAGWMVPYCLGALWERGGVRERTAGGVLLVLGAAATALLILRAGYPAAMVGVPGADTSNLSPSPTLAAVTFGLAQCGAALLLAGPLRRALRGPRLRTAVALVNGRAMAFFLWHQTAMIAVTALGLLTGDALPGLHTAPDDPGWVVARLGWLPLFAVALAVCLTAFQAGEHPAPAPGPECSPKVPAPRGTGRA
ncbi:acyltransferase family protein [Streptomyces clavuligerus]|nr:acyltransferase [Streptomyces clavuligerus]AXU15658.1 acyltransferase [Streptomyces clavuligerus]MBY6305777.1 acyltransferase [Streptomyces clavuligerus]QCS08438.1 acyltransferase [Streptomyces clavuligerus]QPJ92225.1 acyltransferase family protein [Streptomyces clavuligerus]QPL65654.1 acyltransferase [Streptomyces clavuligerus]